MKMIKKIAGRVFPIKKIVLQIIRQEFLVNKYDSLSKTSRERGITTDKYFDNEIIVSLTTYGKRIFESYLAIESIMQQTVKPNRIILWLAKDEFTEDNLPLKIKNLISRGLTIEFCDDLKSYKKIIPTLKLFPNETIITVDDDFFYPDDFLECMLSAYKMDKRKIYFYRGHKIKLGKDGQLLPYKKWKFGIEDTTPSVLNFPVGCGGVLYPPKSLHKEVLNKDNFIRLSPKADDLWLKTMALLNGTECQKIDYYTSFKERFTSVTSMQEGGLFHTNYLNNENDEQLKNLFKEYNVDLGSAL